MKPRVSVILPTHNRRDMLVLALESCWRQTYADFEIVLVDDGSSDGTEAYVRGLNDPRLVYVRLCPAQGMVPAFNAGFAHARGEYLTLLSDDDLFVPETLAVFVHELDRNRGVDFVYAHYEKIDVNGVSLGPGRVEDPVCLDRDNYIGHCFLYRRKIYDEIGGYDARPVLVEDYAYWLRVRKKFRMKRLPQVLFYHRMHPESLTMVYGASKVGEALERARRPYIPVWKHYFLAAERRYHARLRWPALGHVVVALLLRPFYGPSWRLLALVTLPAALVAGIRSVRSGKRSSSCAA